VSESRIVILERVTAVIGIAVFALVLYMVFKFRP